jgi:hypothetical protein
MGTRQISSNLFLIDRFWINFIAIKYWSGSLPVGGDLCYDKNLPGKMYIREDEDLLLTASCAF